LEIKYKKLIRYISPYFYAEKQNEFVTISFTPTESFILYFDYLNSQNNINTVILENNEKCNKKDCIYNLSSIKFISMYLTLENTNYDINLTYPNNYYIVNNILDYKFLNYYLLKTYPILNNKNLIGSTIVIIDNKVNIISETFTNEFQIQILENNYNMKK
jgi:hypothetical protein